MKSVILFLSLFSAFALAQKGEFENEFNFESYEDEMMVRSSEIRSGSDGNSHIQLSSEKISISKSTQIKIKITRLDGTTPKIIPTSDHDLHFIATKDREDVNVVHLHPVPDSEKNTWILTCIFPKTGEYQVWVQFMDNKDLRNIPLFLKVYR